MNLNHIMRRQTKKEDKMWPSCIVCDFDTTLAYFIDYKQRLFRIFTKRKVPPHIVKESYEEIKQKGGFTIQRLQKIIESKVKQRFDPASVALEFSQWLERSLMVYPDTHTVIPRWRDRGIPFIIATVGDQGFQRKKIEASGILFDALYIVDKEGSKTLVLKELLAKYGRPIIFIDDKPSELDSVRSALKKDDVITVIIRRPDCPKNKTRSLYHHREITTLNEIDEWLSINIKS